MPLQSAESIQVKHGEHGAVQNAQGLQLGEGELVKPFMKPVGAADTVLIKEVPSIRSVLYREVPRSLLADKGLQSPILFCTKACRAPYCSEQRPAQPHAVCVYMVCVGYFFWKRKCCKRCRAACCKKAK